MDECVSRKHVAAVFAAAGHVAHVQGPQTFGTGTLDIDWLPKVGEKGWVLITKDKHIRKRSIERRALQQAGVRAFVLTGGSLSGEDLARVFKEALPAMLRLLRRYPPPFIARVTSESGVEIIQLSDYPDRDELENGPLNKSTP